MPELIHAIKAINPDAIFKYVDDDINTIEWQEGTKPIANDVILAKLTELQTAYDALQYQRNRAKAYPSIVDQLDTLYHGGYDAWKASIDVVKNKYPKGAAL